MYNSITELRCRGWKIRIERRSKPRCTPINGAPVAAHSLTRRSLLEMPKRARSVRSAIQNLGSRAKKVEKLTGSTSSDRKSMSIVLGHWQCHASPYWYHIALSTQYSRHFTPLRVANCQPGCTGTSPSVQDLENQDELQVDQTHRRNDDSSNSEPSDLEDFESDLDSDASEQTTGRDGTFIDSFHRLPSIDDAKLAHLLKSG